MQRPPFAFARALEALAGQLLSPPACAACGGSRTETQPFCPACGLPLPAAPCAFDGVPLVVAGAYAPPLAPAIRRLKFEGHAELAPELARLLVPHLALLGSLAGASFVPVPLHRARLVERGFNQAALLARALAEAAGGHFLPRALERRRETSQQARLGKRDREANVKEAFVARKVPPTRVILVDDVVTTGSTALACLRTLRQAGFEVLAVVALARAEGAG
jgi:ComF family protein